MVHLSAQYHHELQCNMIQALIVPVKLELLSHHTGNHIAVIGKLDFSNLFWVLGNVPPGTGSTLDALKKAGVPVLAYGSFITVAVNFVILAFIIFLMVKQINRLKNDAPAAAPAPATTPEDVVLLREIRDALRK